MSAAPRQSPVDDAELAAIIASGSGELRLDLPASAIDRLVAYLRLIERWNATYNLTAVRDPRDMATQHILDCLAAMAALRRRRADTPVTNVLDVGSGAGLPGVVFAIGDPDLAVTCIDSVGKKSAFVTQVASTLGLANVRSLHGRVEAMTAPLFDVIVCRAFAALANFVSATAHLLAPHGTWMAMKGKLVPEEVRAAAGTELHVEPLRVPGLAAERCIVWLTPMEASARL